MPTLYVCLRHYATMAETARVTGLTPSLVANWAVRNNVEFWDTSYPLNDAQLKVRMRLIERLENG